MDDRKKKVEGYFDDIVKDYARLYDAGESLTTYPGGPMRLQKAIALLRQYMPTGALLDVGCGTGHTLLAAARCGYRVIGIDLSTQMVERSAALLKQNGFADRSTFKTGDVEHMPIETASVDAVLALGLIEYLPDDTQFISEIRRVLRPGGIAVIAFRNRLFNLFSSNSYTQQEADAREFSKLLQELRDEFDRGASQTRFDAFVQELSQRAPHFAARSAPSESLKLKPLPIHLRQHTPKQARDAFARAYLKPIATEYFHFHPFPPAFEPAGPTLFNSLGLAMESLGSTPIGALMASAFLCVFQSA